MRNISQLAVSLALLATQVYTPFLGTVTATAEASTPAVGVYEVKLNTNTASPVEIVGQTKPDFDAEVLVPLRAAQVEAAAKAAQAAAKKRAKVRTKSTTVVTAVRAAPTAENMLKLRLCEAGNVYTRNSGNGYYGAYQFNNGTWNNYGGYARADLAPASVQDAKFLETFSRRGWSPWPACARKLGLR